MVRDSPLRVVGPFVLLAVLLLAGCFASGDQAVDEWWALAPCERVEEVTVFVQIRADEFGYDRFQGAECEIPDGIRPDQIYLVVDRVSTPSEDKLHTEVNSDVRLDLNPHREFDFLGVFCNGEFELRSRGLDSDFSTALLGDFQHGANSCGAPGR